MADKKSRKQKSEKKRKTEKSKNKGYKNVSRTVRLEEKREK